MSAQRRPRDRHPRSQPGVAGGTGWHSERHVDWESPVYVISVAADLAEMHPQTLRQYDRIGLVVPQRQGGRQRRYSRRDVDQLRTIQSLSRNGVSLEGIRRIVELEQQVADLQDTVAELAGQVQQFQSYARFPRVFTAGATGDVTATFHARNQSRDGGSGQSADDTPTSPQPGADARVIARRWAPRRALAAGAAPRPKVLMWTPQD